jgi:glycosyltransferase involved in cell wall biosynthesis
MKQCFENWPLVSICIPAYNTEKTIQTTPDSIVCQDYTHYEIVVSDNHSTDLIAEIVRSQADRGVRYCMPPDRADWAAGMLAYIGAYVNANFVLSRQQQLTALSVIFSNILQEAS